MKNEEEPDFIFSIEQFVDICKNRGCFTEEEARHFYDNYSIECMYMYLGMKTYEVDRAVSGSETVH